MSFARAKLSSSVGTGPTRCPERVAGGVPPHRPVALERVERAHAEQLEVVERLEVGAVDHGGPLRLEPERDARPREERAVVPDERDVGGAPNADEPRSAARLADAGDDRVEHVGVREPVDRLANAVRERRAERDDDLGRIRPRRRDVAVSRRAPPCRPRRRPASAGRRRAEAPGAAPSARPRGGTPSPARGTCSGRSPPSGRARRARSPPTSGGSPPRRAGAASRRSPRRRPRSRAGRARARRRAPTRRARAARPRPRRPPPGRGRARHRSSARPSRPRPRPP